MPTLPTSVQVLLDSSRPPDPRSLAFAVERELADLAPHTLAIVRFLAHRADDATDAPIRQFLAALLLEVVGLIGSVSAAAKQRFIVALEPHTPRVPPECPYTRAEGRAFIIAISGLDPPGRVDDWGLHRLLHRRLLVKAVSAHEKQPAQG